MLMNPIKVLDKIERAVHATLEMQESGTRGEDALVKVAAAEKLTPEQIRRTAQIVNRSSVNYQRLFEESLPRKLASVEVIDPDRVIQRVFSIKEAERPSVPGIVAKMASAVEKLPPKSVTAKKTQKLARSNQPEGPKIRPRSGYGLYHGLAGEKLVETVEKWERQKKEAEAAMSRAIREAEMALTAAERKLASIPVPEQARVLDQARYYYEETQPVVNHVVMYLADTLDPEVQAKLAIVPETPDTWSDYLFGRNGLSPLLERTADLVVSLRDKLDEQKVKVAEAEAHLEIIQSSLRGGRVERVGVAAGEDVAERDKRWIEQKIAAATQGGGGSDDEESHTPKVQKPQRTPKPVRSMDSVLDLQKYFPDMSTTDMDTEKDETHFLTKLRSPAHEADLRAVRSRAILQDLVATDPVLKSVPTAEVVSAYNDLVSAFPLLAERRASLRAALRQYVGSSGSPGLFELKQVQDLQRNPSYKDK